MRHNIIKVERKYIFAGEGNKLRQHLIWYRLYTDVDSILRKCSVGCIEKLMETKLVLLFYYGLIFQEISMVYNYMLIMGEEMFVFYSTR